MSLHNLTYGDLKALSKLVAEKERLQSKIAAINARLENLGLGKRTREGKKPRKKLSTEARARIAAGQKRRRENERKAKTPI